MAECTIHHHACDCREAMWKAEFAKLGAELKEAKTAREVQTHNLNWLNNQLIACEVKKSKLYTALTIIAGELDLTCADSSAVIAHAALLADDAE